MSMVSKIIGTAVAIALIAQYLGLLVKLRVVEQKVGPFRFYFRDVDPLKASHMSASLEIRLLLRRAGVRDCHAFSIVPHELYAQSRTSKFGWVVPGKHRRDLDGLPGVGVQYLPVSECMVVEFPRGGVFASAVGLMRARRALARHRSTHGYQNSDIYVERFASKTLFAQPIRR